MGKIVSGLLRETLSGRFSCVATQHNSPAKAGGIVLAGARATPRLGFLPHRPKRGRAHHAPIFDKRIVPQAVIDATRDHLSMEMLAVLERVAASA